MKLCLKHGVDVIYHATLVDDEAKDLLEAVRERVFIAPVIGHLLTTIPFPQRWILAFAALLLVAGVGLVHHEQYRS